MMVWESSPGGLVSALRPILSERSCTWIGWAGGASLPTSTFEHDGITNVAVPVSDSELEAYYEGFSNRIIWPLYHDAVRAPEYNHAWWPTYVAVNERFAEAVAARLEEGGMAWVHDYHLQLLPAMLRRLRPDVRIGFFLHIPFPPQELFAQLPWREAILQGILASDVVGFQTVVGAQNFAQVSQRFAGAAPVPGGLRLNSHDIRVDHFPISVDVAAFESLAAEPAVLDRSRMYRDRLGRNRRVMLGLDRLDYTKGIDLRLRAYYELLRSGRASRDDVVFVQVAVPSREHVDEYRVLRVEVERLVGRINGRFSDLGRTPLQYMHRSVGVEDLVALYLTADVMVVTPLRDGMNLIAKEYAACRTENDGVLVLSEFAGAARELSDALLVNPHDVEALADSMARALNMSPAEQSTRMRSMREALKRNDVHHWADRFFNCLSYERA